MSQTRSGENRCTLSIWGWITLLAKATAIVFGLLTKAITELFRNRRGSLTFHQYIGYAAVRDFQKGLDAIGIQSLLPSTSATCIKYARAHGLKQREIRLPEGTIAQWLGPRNVAKVVVLFHGGGYMSPALNEHLSLVFGFGRVPRVNISAVVLQYDLASEHANHYPRQLQQAVFLTDYLINHERISPAEIILLGDSAGAHLLTSLVLHLSHSNPLVSPLKIAGQFAGAALISPWIKMDSAAESIIANKDKDTLTADALEYWARNFLNACILDYWNSPLMVPVEWLENLPITEILILYGDNELLRDDTVTFCERLKIHHLRTTALSFSGEVHSHMLLNQFLKINKSSESEEVFINWIDEHLSRQKHVQQRL